MYSSQRTLGSVSILDQRIPLLGQSAFRVHCIKVKRVGYLVFAVARG
jgi:hypothetical protein